MRDDEPIGSPDRRNRARLRAAWVTFLGEEMEPDVEVMLGMGLGASAEAVNAAATEFLKRIEGKANGRRWHKFPPEERLTVIGFHEHPHSNRHVHLFARGNSRIQKELMLGAPLWKSLRRGGDYHCDVIHNRKAYARYGTKELFSDRSFADVFVYKPKE